MSVQQGRIGGPLLADNLLRNGANLAFEHKVLFLDVVNKRIGFNNAAPVNDLYTPTAIDSINLIVDTTADIGNFVVSGSTIQHVLSNPITISPSQNINPSISTPGLSTANLYLYGNNFSNTVTNNSVNFTPSSSSGQALTAVSSSDVTAIIGQTLTLVQTGGSNGSVRFSSGGIGVTGTVVVGGSGYSDGTAYVIDVSSNVYSLVITTGFVIGNINLANDNKNVQVNVNASLHATGNITFDGSIQLGTSSSNTITLVAEVNSNIVPVGIVNQTVQNIISQNSPLFIGLDDESLLYTGTSYEWDLGSGGPYTESQLLSFIANQTLQVSVGSVSGLLYNFLTTIDPVSGFRYGDINNSGTILASDARDWLLLSGGGTSLRSWWDNVVKPAFLADTVLEAQVQMAITGHSALQWLNVYATTLTAEKTTLGPLAATTAKLGNVVFTGNNISDSVNDINFATTGTGVVKFNSIDFFSTANTITFPSSTVTLNSTGTGYFKFAGTSGLAIPVGTNLNRPASPVEGTVRYDTALSYVEVYSSSQGWIPAYGQNANATVQNVEDYSTLYSIVFGY